MSEQPSIPLLPTTTLLSRAQQQQQQQHQQPTDFPAVIRVQNLATTLLTASHDAWNRPNRLQPCLLSCSISFKHPFSSASSTDTLAGGDTIHYGILSSTIRDTVETNFGPSSRHSTTAEGGSGTTTQTVLAKIWQDLTTTSYNGTPSQVKKPGLLSPSLERIGLLSVTVTLPRASLLGEGVSFTASAMYNGAGEMEARAMEMNINRLRVPTLVGLNENEREARQMLVVSVGVDGVAVEGDKYFVVERAVVKALEESSFETLEALGAHLMDKVEEVFVNGRDYTVHVKMEKPIAVPTAECPVVEMRRVVKDYYR
ncbi:hypothetical protein QBC40DRAFT_287389 [Triangularia verruculosa]|uniref:Dihydroneopterin aldolase/epimerase domain-containing protein n=1 Tax=Triangularia verruculosa TaxID=2587418 RepID=A0AAN6XD22_9PEZI|nr:hypothetical protein QBC40DRAFT_287389 [Triangularia verruculosa]